MKSGALPSSPDLGTISLPLASGTRVRVLETHSLLRGCGRAWVSNLGGYKSTGVSWVVCLWIPHRLRSQGRTGGYVFDHMHENVPFLWSKKLNNITDYFKDKI